MAGACVVRLASNVNSALKLQRSGAADVDESLATSKLLEVTLICFILILELILSSIDFSFKRADELKLKVDALKKKPEGAKIDFLWLQDEVGVRLAKEDKGLAAGVKSQKEIICDLQQKLEQAQVDVNSKEKELKSATTSLKALEKQTVGFQNEYTRVMDDNENLHFQFSLFDRKYASSGNKKNS